VVDEELKVKVAARIVQMIVMDLTGRAGIKHTWSEIDPNIRSGIKDKWVQIILRVLDQNFQYLFKEKGQLESDPGVFKTEDIHQMYSFIETCLDTHFFEHATDEQLLIVEPMRKLMDDLRGRTLEKELATLRAENKALQEKVASLEERLREELDDG